MPWRTASPKKTPYSHRYYAELLRWLLKDEEERVYKAVIQVWWTTVEEWLDDVEPLGPEELSDERSEREWVEKHWEMEEKLDTLSPVMQGAERMSLIRSMAAHEQLSAQTRLAQGVRDDAQSVKDNLERQLRAMNQTEGPGERGCRAEEEEKQKSEDQKETRERTEKAGRGKRRPRRKR